MTSVSSAAVLFCLLSSSSIFSACAAEQVTGIDIREGGTAVTGDHLLGSAPLVPGGLLERVHFEHAKEEGSLQSAGAASASATTSAAAIARGEAERAEASNREVALFRRRKWNTRFYEEYPEFAMVPVIVVLALCLIGFVYLLYRLLEWLGFYDDEEVGAGARAVQRQQLQQQQQPQGHALMYQSPSGHVEMITPGGPLNIPLVQGWRGELMCDGETAGRRARVLMENKDISGMAAQKQVMADFPDVFGPVPGWNPSLICAGTTAEQQAKWLMDNEGITPAEAQKRVMSRFLAHDQVHTDAKGDANV